MATFTRRTDRRTWAPILRSARRKVPQVASANWVVGEADAAQCAEQDIGHGGEPQPQLVGAHGGRRGAGGEQVQLAFLHPVLHVAAGAVDALVERTGVAFAGLERGDDEARVGLAAGPLGLADDASSARPAVEGGPAEVAEAPGGLACPGRVVLGPGEVDGEFLDQARVARQAEDEVDAVALAPGHQRLADEAGIRPEQDADPGPAGADL